MIRAHLVNVLFGITLFNLAIIGIHSLKISYTFLFMARLCIIASNLVMGALLICNKRSQLGRSPLSKPYWLGMIICNVAIFKFISEVHPIISAASFVFIAGFSILLLALFAINSSFSVTPMVSSIKTKSLYGIIRHPMYFGESIMLLSCVFASITRLSYLVFVIYIISMIFRINEEENVLQSDEYKSYCMQVPWRLFPYVW